MTHHIELIVICDAKCG